MSANIVQVTGNRGMTERRFNEAEVAAIFEHAAEAQQISQYQFPQAEGMTLAELQEIGREVGISRRACRLPLDQLRSVPSDLRVPRASNVSRRSTTSRSHSSSESFLARSIEYPTPIGRPRKRRVPCYAGSWIACAAFATSSLEFVHSVTGVGTLKDEFDKVASHNEHHLEQIRLALGPLISSSLL